MRTIKRELKIKLAFSVLRKTLRFARRQAEKTDNVIDDKLVGLLEYLLAEAEKLHGQFSGLEIASKKELGTLVEIELKEALRKKLRE